MNMARHRTLTFPLLCLMECLLISAFNLDTENVIKKTGDAKSLFGFSLALHRQLIPTDKKMLLVGAPNATKLPQQSSLVTGGLYNCDINSAIPTCERVQFDNDEDPNTESKANQWMGVTVQSQGPGGKILTCAHRYQKRAYINTRQEARDITGRCYLFSQSLQIDESTGDEGGDWSFCEGRNRGHERFGSCQQGLSATFTKDYHYLVFGAPGGFNWKGRKVTGAYHSQPWVKKKYTLNTIIGIVRLEQRNNTLMEMGYYDDGPFEVKYRTPEGLDGLGIPANSYLGFSLDSGKMVTKKDQLTVVAGAPRANHSGAVVLLKKESEASTKMVTEYIIQGEGLASSFGYELVVVDLNGDGWQDLVVGAPQYFEKNSDIGGAVYVFINQNGDWDKAIRTRIDGEKNSMFGLAIENLGDLNLDGFNDVAVGAPYADAGYVYIYHGSKDGLKLEPVQILEGRKLNIPTFGYSLAGNMDLDNNQYPDLAVGSLSDTVVVFRARPVVNIKKTVTSSPKDIDLTKKNCDEGFCITLEACFTFTSNSKDYRPSVKVKYVIQVDTKRKMANLPPRAVFWPASSTDTQFDSTGFLELKKQNVRDCVQKKLKFQEQVNDKLSAMPISVNVAIQQPLGRGKRQAGLGELSPVLSDYQPLLSEVHFLKEGCGTDLSCQSNLELQYIFCSKEPNQDIFNPLPLENGVPVISPSYQKEIALEVTVTNKNGDSAYESVLHVSLPSSLSYSKSYSNSGEVHCTANQDGSAAECNLETPFTENSEVVFYIVLSTGGISLQTTEVEVELELKTMSEQTLQPMKKKANVVMELLLSVSGLAKPSQVDFSGSVLGESAMKSETDIGSQIDYEFRVINFGKPLKTLGTVFLNIEWPKSTATNKWLLYLMKITTTGTHHIGCTPNEVNTLHLSEDSSPPMAKQVVKNEDKSKPDKGIISSLRSERKSRVLTCSDGASCVTLKCPLQGMENNAIIALKARLWNGTFIEDFADMNFVDIIVNASISLDSAPKHVLLKNKNNLVRVTVFPLRKETQYRGVSWWIILVAILLGLLLLGLLAFLLWKCGFFGKNEPKNEPEKERLTSDA